MQRSDKEMVAFGPYADRLTAAETPAEDRSRLAGLRAAFEGHGRPGLSFAMGWVVLDWGPVDPGPLGKVRAAGALESGPDGPGVGVTLPPGTGERRGAPLSDGPLMAGPRRPRL